MSSALSLLSRPLPNDLADAFNDRLPYQKIGLSGQVRRNQQAKAATPDRFRRHATDDQSPITTAHKDFFFFCFFFYIFFRFSQYGGAGKKALGQA